MRVGYLTYGLDRTPTGIGRYALEVVRALATFPDGPEIVLLSTERQKPPELPETLEYHRLPGCHLLPSLMTFGNVLISMAARYYQLDVIHDPNGIAPFLGPTVGACRLVTIHDMFAYVYPDKHNYLDNWRYRWHLPLAVRRADGIITVSACSQHDICYYFKLENGSVSVIGEGVDPRFRPIPDTPERREVLARYGIKQPYLLYVGSINARKNIARLFEAYARISSLYPDVTLVIGGKKQWQTREIYETFSRLQLEDRVYFTGYVDDGDLPALYSAARAFVFPSLYEGFGLPPLEAMACNTPVVTSNVSSLPEVAGDAALLIDPYDVESLAQALCQVLDDAALVARLQEKGRAQVAQYTWEQTARQTLHVYENIRQKR